MALIEDTIIADIIDEYEAAKKVPGTSEWDAYKAAAQAVGVTAAMVQQHVKALRSTVRLAKMKILAKSSAMVDKIVEKAPTNELIDILSRPNVGVLEPAQKGQQSNGGFILSVAMDSCGAVRATAAMLPESEPLALPPLVDLNVLEGVSDAPHPATAVSAPSIRERLARARAESTGAAAEETGGQRGAGRREAIRRIQDADGTPRSRALGSGRSKIHLREDHEGLSGEAEM